MEVKTRQDAEALLCGISEEIGVDKIEDAADFVLLHYTSYDYLGSDRLFLAFCEEIVNENILPPAS
jgi:hypothetical protein